MSTNSQKRQILAKIRNDKEYRDNFVAEQIYSRLPLKIRNMRIGRKMKQRELAANAAVAPEWITQVENPNYGRFTLKTLLKLASALDVALYVDFVPYSKVVNDTFSLENHSFEVPSAKDDIGLMERKEPRSEDAHEEELAMAANDGVREVQPKNNLAIMKRDATPNELGTATDQGDDPQEIQEGAAFSAAAGAGIGSQQNSLSGLSI